MSWMRNEVPLKAASLVLAFFIWAYLRTEVNPMQAFLVPLEYVGLPEDLALSGDLLDSVAVRVRGPAATLQNLTPSRFDARIRLNSTVPGEMTIPLTRDAIRAPIGVEVVRVDPQSLTLQVERRIRREVPVVARFSGEPASGYEYDGYTLVPDRVTVEGPESLVSKVQEAVTEEVDMSGRVGSFEAVVGVVPDRGGVRLVDRPTATLRVSIRRERVTRRYPEIPLLAQQPAASNFRVTYQPERIAVELEGTQEDLDAIRDGDIRAVLDLEGMGPRAAPYLVKPRITIGSGSAGANVAVRSISEPTINVTIRSPER